MARFAVGLVFGVVVGVVGGAALQLHAAEATGNGENVSAPEDDTSAAADAVAVPTSTPEPAYSASVWARVACLEQKESGGANIANRRGSGAVGVLQYMPSTFAAHAAELHHPEWSPWVPDQARTVAAHDLVLGRRAQWTVSGC